MFPWLSKNIEQMITLTDFLMIQSNSLIDSYLGLGQSVKIWSH